MTYVGAVPTTGDFKKLDSITTSSATTFNLRQNSVAVYPQSANHCIVSLNGVIQAPVDAFTIVNDTIVFASSLASSDVINFILVLGNVNDIGVPSDSSVSLAKLTATGTASSSTFLRGDNSWAAAGADADNYFATSGLSSKDLGVGLHVKSADSSASVDSSADELVIEGSGASGMTLLSGTSSSGSIYFGDSGDNDIGYVAYNHSSNALMFGANANEGLRVTGDGAVSIGTTETAYSNLTQADDNGIILTDGSASIFATNTDVPLVVARSNGDSAARDCVIFSRGGVTCGTITATPSATSYNTSSDYRLKENVDYDFDATTRLKQLKPVRFNFIADETNTLVDGFLAHEVSSIVPEAIIGEKDGIEKNEDGTNKLDNDGNTIPKYQGIDQAKLVPLLVKTIQELEVRIKTLEDA